MQIPEMDWIIGNRLDLILLLLFKSVWFGELEKSQASICLMKLVSEVKGEWTEIGSH